MQYDGIGYPGGYGIGAQGPRLKSYDRRVLLGEQVTQTDVAWFWSQVAQAYLCAGLREKALDWEYMLLSAQRLNQP
jgi:hypothetical protein